jgi:hypothetical protein
MAAMREGNGVDCKAKMICRKTSVGLLVVVIVAGVKLLV